MQVIDAGALAAALDYPTLVASLREAFATGAIVPLRSHHSVETDGTPGILLLMPSWAAGGPIGIKIATVFPDNAAQNLPAVQATYLLLDGTNGVPLALLDGKTLTARRTAAASVLAASYLARQDATRLLIVGTGVIAAELLDAYAATRSLRRITVWGRTRAKAEELAEAARARGIPAHATADLHSGVAEADIVSCATLSKTPLIRGELLRPGTHVDLVGGFTPEMREADDDAVRRATLFVDTRAGGLAEAGDLVDPIRRGVIGKDSVAAELAELASGRHPGRRSVDEITLFKSVGTALEDLAAARLALSKVK